MLQCKFYVPKLDLYWSFYLCLNSWVLRDLNWVYVITGYYAAVFTDRCVGPRRICRLGSDIFLVVYIYIYIIIYMCVVIQLTFLVAGCSRLFLCLFCFFVLFQILVENEFNLLSTIT